VRVQCDRSTMRGQSVSDPRLELALADPRSLESLVLLYEKLTGKNMSAAGIAELRAEVEKSLKSQD